MVVGKEAAVKRIPSETVTANDNIKVTALWKDEIKSKVKLNLDSNGEFVSLGSATNFNIPKGTSAKRKACA